MKQLTTYIALVSLAFLLTACGESSTDEPLPEGTAPKEAQRDASPKPEIEPVDPGPVPKVDPDIPTSPTPPVVEDTPEYPPLPTPKDDAKRTSAAGLSYVLPEGWTEVLPTSPGAMRLATLVPPTEFVDAELAVFRFPRDVGGFPMNVNRWAGQIGLPPFRDLMTAASSDFEQFKIDGNNATWIPLMNPDTNLAILAVWIPIGEEPENPTHTWTLKMTCKADQVDALAPAVRAWCESIKFED